MTPALPSFEGLKLELTEKIATVSLHRADKANALSLKLWLEIQHAFEWLDQAHDVRVVILKGEGKHFCAGIDLDDFGQVLSNEEECEGRKREKLRLLILKLQNAFTAIERCSKPVIAAIHGGCIGGGVDMVTACDMRFCSSDAFFTVKEIDLGMTADVGTLQRLPHLIPDGLMRELAYTGRKVLAPEAQSLGLVNRVFENRDQMDSEVFALAGQIAAKSPLSIRGTKEMLLYTRDHSVQDALNYVATWNAAMLMSTDLVEAITASMEKREPVFRD